MGDGNQCGCEDTSRNETPADAWGDIHTQSERYRRSTSDSPYGVGVSATESSQSATDGRVVVVGVTRDHAEVWTLDERQKHPLAVVVRHDAKSEHRHVRTAQFGHGHESDEGYSRFFTDVAAVVSGANEIMIAGHGSGRSNMMEIFADWLKDKHAEIFSRVSELRYVDLPHTTGRELAAMARKWKSEQRITGFGQVE